MTIDGEDVRPAVIVVVEEARSPADIGRADRSDFGGIGDVGEKQRLVVTIESGVLTRKIRDENTKLAGVQVIADGHAHGAERNAVIVERHAGLQTDFGKSAVLVVVVEIISGGIVGDEEIEPAVAVNVGPDRSQTIAPFGIGDARFLADVGKCAVAVVVEQRIAGARQTFGAALHGHSAILAELGFAELGELGEIDVDVVGDEEIQRAVFVVVGNRCAGGPARIVDSGVIAVMSVKVPLPLLR